MQIVQTAKKHKADYHCNADNNNIESNKYLPFIEFRNFHLVL